MYRSADKRQVWVRSLAKTPIVIFSAFAIIFSTASPSAYAQDRSVEQYSCKDVMRESGPNRDVAIAFLHGFLLGKTGASQFNVDELRRQSDQFIEACLDRPNDKAVDVMAAARK